MSNKKPYQLCRIKELCHVKSSSCSLLLDGGTLQDIRNDFIRAAPLSALALHVNGRLTAKPATPLIAPSQNPYHVLFLTIAAAGSVKAIAGSLEFYSCAFQGATSFTIRKISLHELDCECMQFYNTHVVLNLWQLIFASIHAAKIIPFGMQPEGSE